MTDLFSRPRDEYIAERSGEFAALIRRRPTMFEQASAYAYALKLVPTPASGDITFSCHGTPPEPMVRCLSEFLASQEYRYRVRYSLNEENMADRLECELGHHVSNIPSPEREDYCAERAPKLAKIIEGNADLFSKSLAIAKHPGIVPTGSGPRALQEMGADFGTGPTKLAHYMAGLEYDGGGFKFSTNPHAMAQALEQKLAPERYDTAPSSPTDDLEAYRHKRGDEIMHMLSNEEAVDIINFHISNHPVLSKSMPPAHHHTELLLEAIDRFAAAEYALQTPPTRDKDAIISALKSKHMRMDRDNISYVPFGKGSAQR